MRKKPSLENYKLYENNREDVNILKSEKESPINIANLQLVFCIYIMSIFYQVLIDSSKS